VTASRSSRVTSVGTGQTMPDLVRFALQEVATPHAR